jgi:hypothetical protein
VTDEELIAQLRKDAAYWSDTDPYQAGRYREAADRIEALTAKNERLREALEAHEKHMAAGQTLAVKYLVPEVDPDSIGKDEFVSRIIEHFDGPDQRTVQAKAQAALEKQP